MGVIRNAAMNLKESALCTTQIKSAPKSLSDCVSARGMPVVSLCENMQGDCQLSFALQPAHQFAF